MQQIWHFIVDNWLFLLISATWIILTIRGNFAPKLYKITPGIWIRETSKKKKKKKTNRLKPYPKTQPNLLLKAARQVRRWSQERTAEEVGVDMLTYGRWERGEQRPQKRHLNQICNVFSKSAQDLGLEKANRSESEEESKRVILQHIQRKPPDGETV